MSRAKAQRLLSEILTLFDGPPSLAVQGLIAVLSGRGLLLAPRGHHFENLANAVAWSFNGVIRKIANDAPLEVTTLLEGGQLPHVLLLEGVDSGRLVKLRAVLRRLTEPDGPRPDLMFFLATADPAVIPPLGHPDRAIWDELFGLRVNGRDSVQRGPTVLADLEPDTLGVEAILPEDIVELRKDVAAVPLPAALEAALERIPALLVVEGWARLPPSAAQDLGIAARAVAFLRGKPEVNLSHVADVLHPALTARLSSGESSSTELLDAVEIVWDEAAGQGDSNRPRAPQRKTFVGIEGSLDVGGSSSHSDSGAAASALAEVGTDPLVTAPVPVSSGSTGSRKAGGNPDRAAAFESTDAETVGTDDAKVARPRRGKGVETETPQSIHEAYYSPPPAYKAPTFGAANAAEEADADASELEAPRKPRVRRRSLWPTLISASLLAAIAVLATVLFPNWPMQLYGVGLAALAQEKLWSGEYVEAQATAQAALEKLGPRHGLAQRVETISFLAHHELLEQSRRDREAAAREAYHMRHFEEAAAAFDALAQEFPDHPRYSQLAAQARLAQDKAAKQVEGTSAAVEGGTDAAHGGLDATSSTEPTPAEPQTRGQPPTPDARSAAQSHPAGDEHHQRQPEKPAAEDSAEPATPVH